MGLYYCHLFCLIFKQKQFEIYHLVAKFYSSKRTSLQRPTSVVLAFPLMSASSSLSSSLSFLMQSKYSFCLSKAWPHTQAKTGEGRRGRGEVGETQNTEHTCNTHASGNAAGKQQSKERQTWQCAHTGNSQVEG